MGEVGEGWGGGRGGLGEAQQTHTSRQRPTGLSTPAAEAEASAAVFCDHLSLPVIVKFCHQE